MDRLEAMSLLVAAVEAGSLSAGARRLGVPLATMSRKVSELESQLRTRLLVRSTRRLSLTDAGRAYVESCRRILDQVAEAERVAAGEYQAPRGDLAITAPVVFGRLHVLPIVVDFLKAHSQIDVRLTLADQLVSLLEQADRPGGEDRRVAGQQPRVNTAEAAIDAAICGLGITRCLSYQVAAALRSGALATVLDAFERRLSPVSLVHAGGRLLPLKLRAFLDFAAPRLRESLAAR